MQGHWEVLIVPLIALGVWILGTLFKTEDERAKQQRPRRPLSDGGVRVPQRRPVTDLDRFLEEARRRREAGEKGPVPAAPTEVVVPPQRVTRPAPSQEQRPQREAPRRPQRPVPTSPPPRPRPEEPLKAIPISRPGSAPARAAAPLPKAPVPMVSSIEAPIDPVPTAGAPPSIPAMPGTPRGQAASPILAQVTALLRSPQAAGFAVVLREIFDRPLCKRPRA